MFEYTYVGPIYSRHMNCVNTCVYIHECKRVQLNRYRLVGLLIAEYRPLSQYELAPFGVTLIWGSRGPCGLGEGMQSGHHHHPTQQMTGVLEHACAKFTRRTILNHNTRTLHMARQKSYIS